MTLAIDGHIYNTLDFFTPSASVYLTTSGTDRIVVVVCHNEGPTVVPFNPPTSSGLVFAKRASHTFADSQTYGAHTSLYQDHEVWWAYASAQLSAQPVTVSVSVSGSIDSGTFEVFAVSGVDSSRFATGGWDTNGSLPAYNTNGTSSPVAVSASGISTTSTNDMLFSFLSGDTSFGVVLSAMTSVIDSVAYGYYFNSAQLIETGTLSSPQSSISIVQTGGGNPPWWGIIVDAMTSDVATVATSGTVVQTLEPVTQAASGTVTPSGIVVQTLEPVTQAASGMLIINIIAMTLKRVKQRVSGAQIGAGGTGGWYSWWMQG